MVIGQTGFQVKIDDGAYAVDGDHLIGLVIVGVNAVHFLQGGIGGVDDAVDVHRHFVVAHLIQHHILCNGDQVAVGGMTGHRGRKQRQQQGKTQYQCKQSAHDFPLLSVIFNTLLYDECEKMARVRISCNKTAIYRARRRRYSSVSSSGIRSPVGTKPWRR